MGFQSTFGNVANSLELLGGRGFPLLSVTNDREDDDDEKKEDKDEDEEDEDEDEEEEAEEEEEASGLMRGETAANGSSVY